jgi:hypothetical protein
MDVTGAANELHDFLDACRNRRLKVIPFLQLDAL